MIMTMMKKRKMKMKAKALGFFRTKISSPFTRLLRVFKFRVAIKKPLSIFSLLPVRRLRTTKSFHDSLNNSSTNTPAPPPPVKFTQIRQLRSVFRSLRKYKKMPEKPSARAGSFVLDQLRGGGGGGGGDNDDLDMKKLFPSPVTPAYDQALKNSFIIKGGGGGGGGGGKVDDEVEDACRSFENYLVEMMVEEGKVRDLMDVEELLYCWNNLKSPLFIDLVCRFYGELCKDLFASDN